MKLSDFENEDALDLLAAIIEPAAEIMGDPKVVQLYKEKPMLFVVAEILKNHKKSAMEIVAAMHGKEPDECKFNVITLTKDVLDILNDPEILQVFSSQSQMTDEKPSGSATESTVDSGK